MNEPLDRRAFLRTASHAAIGMAGLGLLAATPVGAVAPIKRPGTPRLQLSLAAYSFRQFFTAQPPARTLTLSEFIDYCADHGCAAAELTSYYFPKDFGDDYLLALKRRAFLRGIAISGSAVGNNFTEPPGPKRDEQIALVKQWVDHCAVLGAPHIRVCAGATKEKDPATSTRRCIEA